MSLLAVNLVLALVWALLIGMSLTNVVIGFVIGFVLLAASQPLLPSGRYVRSGLAVVTLVLLFARELVVANLKLARDVLRRQPRFEPAFLRIEVTDLGPAQTALLAALVSLTPGSITVDISADGGTLFVHTVYAAQPEEARRSVRGLADAIRRAGGSGRTSPQDAREEGA